MNEHPSYMNVFMTFVRNSLVREMTFRTNFLLQCVSAISWPLMNLGFFKIIFGHTEMIGRNTGWGEHEFYIFLATTWLVNSIVQAFFMPNAQEFSELIRTGNLDFALVKPIDTQFLISFTRVDWSALTNFAMGLILLVYSVWVLSTASHNPLVISWTSVLLYPIFLMFGIGILYSVMISLAATSIWLGRNQTLYNFWFYITNFYRYPMEIYQRGIAGWSLWGLFTFAVPILIVANVPARMLAQPLRPEAPGWQWLLAGFMILATFGSLLASRWIFKQALLSYRSASS